MSKETKSPKEFTLEDIQVLTGLEPIRKRPGMYVGSVDARGMHQLLMRFVDFSYDQYFGAYDKIFSFVLNQDGSFTVKTGIDQFEVIQAKKTNLQNNPTLVMKIKDFMTRIKTSKSSLLLTVPNALSEWAWVEIIDREDNKVYRQEYKQGVEQGQVEILEGLAVIEKFGDEWSNIFCFKPDPEIFYELDFNYDWLFTHLRIEAFLTRGLRINLQDRRDPKMFQENTFYFENGVAAYVQKLDANGKMDTFNTASHNTNVVQAEGKKLEVEIEAAFKYDYGSNTILLCYVNHDYTESHNQPPVDGFYEALRHNLSRYARQEGLLKPKQAGFTRLDLTHGLVAVISLTLRNPNYLGPSRTTAITNEETRPAVRSVVGKAFWKWLNEHPDEARRLAENRLAEYEHRQNRRRE